MDGNTIGTLAEYIAEQHRRISRDNNRARGLSCPDTTQEDDGGGQQGNERGDGGRDQHPQG